MVRNGFRTTLRFRFVRTVGHEWTVCYFLRLLHYASYTTAASASASRLPFVAQTLKLLLRS